MRLFVINLVILQATICFTSPVPSSSTVSAIANPEKPQKTKTSSERFKSSNGNSPFSVSSAWPKARSLWSNFNENFFNDGFSDSTFGDWKSKIEERSNKVLTGYNDNRRHDNEHIKDKPLIEVSKPRGRSLPYSGEQFRSIKHPNTLYRENIVDEFLDKIIEPQLKEEQNQVNDHVNPGNRRGQQIYQTGRSARRELLDHQRHKKLHKNNDRNFPDKKDFKPRNEKNIQNSHEDYTRFKINGKETSVPFSRISKIEIKPKHNSSTLPIRFSTTPQFPVNEKTQDHSLKFPKIQPFDSSAFELGNEQFKTGSKPAQQFPQERNDNPEKRNDGFFSEGFLSFGSNNIRNFADLFKGGFSDFKDHGQHAQGHDSFDSHEYDAGDDDDSNINYVDDYYPNDDADFQENSFPPGGHDADTRHSSFNFPSSYEDDTSVGLHTTGPGNTYSDNKPKREVFNGNHQEHVKEYKPFQFNDGQFTQSTSVEEPHKNRHHHGNHEDSSYHHSFNNNDVNHETNFGDLGAFQGGHSFENADSNSVKSGIQQSINHAGNLNSDYQPDDFRDDYVYVDGEDFDEENTYDQPKINGNGFGSFSTPGTSGDGTSDIYDTNSSERKPTFGSFSSSETSKYRKEFNSNRVKRKPSEFGSFESFESSANSNAFNSDTERRKPFASFESSESSNYKKQFNSDRDKRNPPQFGSFDNLAHSNGYNLGSETKRPSQIGSFQSFESQDHTNNFHSELESNKQEHFGSIESFDNSDESKRYNSERIKRKPSGFGSFEASDITNDGTSFSGPVEFSHFGGSDAFETPFKEPSSFSSNTPAPPLAPPQTKYKIQNYRKPIQNLGTNGGNSNIYKRENRTPLNAFVSEDRSQTRTKSGNDDARTGFSSVPSRKSSYFPDYNNVKVKKS